MRAVGLGTAILLAAAALLDVTTQLTRSTISASSLFIDGAPVPADFSPTAPMLSLDGNVRSDIAAIQAVRALSQAAGTANLNDENRAAQASLISVLKTSPVNPLMWMALGLLKAQISEPAGPALKTSYLTGHLPPDAILKRLRAVATSDGVDDEDVRLLAQSDVRTILTRYFRLEPALAATYRQATPTGKAFLLDATLAVDPRFSRLLRQ
ncbi:MAG: hypothetical protein JWQ94_1068 [Tardiphaga sp.]|jgi:hypothetical protein|nr:hypothetical protein [Tardiphaga sp.]